MKKIILALSLTGKISSASASEVCRIPTAAIDPSRSICIAKAICTDRSILLSMIEGYKNGATSDLITACALAEIETINALVAIGYKLQTNDTLVKY